MEKNNNKQIEAVEICECNSEWRGVHGGNDWDECQCSLVGEKDGDGDVIVKKPECH